MGRYGEAAIRAAEKLQSGGVFGPKDAWEKATSEIFGKGTSSQRKNCPRSAFLGLCEAGKVKGVPSGDYTRAKENKEYALKALQLLRERSDLSSSPEFLWSKALENKTKTHNHQMDVVIALWESGVLLG